MVYEYTLGDGFKNNSELKSLKQQAMALLLLESYQQQQGFK